MAIQVNSGLIMNVQSVVPPMLNVFGCEDGVYIFQTYRTNICTSQHGPDRYKYNYNQFLKDLGLLTPFTNLIPRADYESLQVSSLCKSQDKEKLIRLRLTTSKRGLFDQYQAGRNNHYQRRLEFGKMLTCTDTCERTSRRWLGDLQ